MYAIVHAQARESSAHSLTRTRTRVLVQRSAAAAAAAAAEHPRRDEAQERGHDRGKKEKREKREKREHKEKVEPHALSLAPAPIHERRLGSESGNGSCRYTASWLSVKSSYR